MPHRRLQPRLVRHRLAFAMIMMQREASRLASQGRFTYRVSLGQASCGGGGSALVDHHVRSAHQSRRRGRDGPRLRRARSWRASGRNCGRSCGPLSAPIAAAPWTIRRGRSGPSAGIAGADETLHGRRPAEGGSAGIGRGATDRSARPRRRRERDDAPQPHPRPGAPRGGDAAGGEGWAQAAAQTFLNWPWLPPSWRTSMMRLPSGSRRGSLRIGSSSRLKKAFSCSAPS